MTSRGQRPSSLLASTIVGLASVAVVAAAALAACGSPTAAAGPAATPNKSASPVPRLTPNSGPAPTQSPAPRQSPAVLQLAPGAGRLPQTAVRPRAYGPAFHALLTDLWLAVKTGNPSYGRPAFFPVGAYKQVKAIYDPAADWRGRLWLDFTLDVRAAHHLLLPRAGEARLVRVIVPSAQAQWVGPGACYNRVGYWHVSGPRVVYRLHGQIRSFGIASLISWRGDWYVVHFGGIVRPAAGMVDSPAAGPGIPGPPGGC